MRGIKKAAVAGVLLLSVLISGSIAAKNAPVQLSADTIQYNNNLKLVQATGNVVITQEAITLTGATAEYRQDTNLAVVSGGIVLTNDTIRLTGATVEYDTATGVGAVNGQPRMEDKEGAWLTGEKVDFFTGEDRAVVTGGVHIVHPGRQIDAVADNAIYYGKDRKVLLTGNARAVQEGNTLTGDTLTVYLSDKTMNAQGNTKLIIIPNEKK
ncbi:MAG TPA: LptA/OstA family protein [Negativicutes bacterium]|nr:LptA/OstA family protein [Negativicutes bacterium]